VEVEKRGKDVSASKSCIFILIASEDLSIIEETEMRINVLQHTPNEGPGMIQEWSQERNHEMWVYHPAYFHQLPTGEETDFLVVLGSPSNPYDSDSWIIPERKLIADVLAAGKPVLGICFGAQQIAIDLGARVTSSPHKEVGWAPVYLKDHSIAGLPEKMTVLHWHQDMFEIPNGAHLLFSSDLVPNQGFLYHGNVVGLQFHVEPNDDCVREVACNDCDYANEGNDLHQTTAQIIAHGVPQGNRAAVFTLLDYLVSQPRQE
jgi:GMP synthase-like glutamine amidotransferase